VRRKSLDRPLSRPLDNKSTTLNGVDEDETTGEEGVVRPGTDELHASAVGLVVVLWIDIEETNLLNGATGGILGQAADVEKTEAGAVVALVGEAVNNELVVVRAAVKCVSSDIQDDVVLSRDNDDGGRKHTRPCSCRDHSGRGSRDREYPRSK
jgi:hypothetical protein